MLEVLPDRVEPQLVDHARAVAQLARVQGDLVRSGLAGGPESPREPIEVGRRVVGRPRVAGERHPDSGAFAVLVGEPIVTGGHVDLVGIGVPPPNADVKLHLHDPSQGLGTARGSVPRSKPYHMGTVLYT